MFKTAQEAKTYTFAGNATLTLSSLKTSARYTYKICAPRENANGVRFVSLLTGPQNTNDFTYIGLLTEGGEFKMTRASKLPAESTPIAAFGFFNRKVLVDGQIPTTLEVRHEGCCGRCGRALTVPESIDRGIGPECAKHVN